MTGKKLIKLGFPQGPVVGLALRLATKASGQLDEDAIERELKAVLENPVQNAAHPYFAELAQALREQSEAPRFHERPTPAPYRIRGEGLEAAAVDQMRQARAFQSPFPAR